MAARRAVVVGAGVNGLVAAVELQRAGMQVEVLEATERVGGACATAEVTLPGFRHDLGSSAFPMGVSSPALRGLRLERYGLKWLQTEAAVTHVLDGEGEAAGVTQWRDLARMQNELPGAAGAAWDRVMRPLVEGWQELAPELLGPPVHVPRHPLLLGRFGLLAVQPMSLLVRELFGAETEGRRARALLAGMAGHAVLPLEYPMSAAIAMVLGVAGHAVGWPVAQGGAQAISDALARCLREAGGVIRTGVRVSSVQEVAGDAELVLCDLTPKQLLEVVGGELTGSYRALLERYRVGPGTFKVDWAMRGAIPWRSEGARVSTTVHVGGDLEEVEGSERRMWEGSAEGWRPERPYLIVVQPGVVDRTRAPEDVGGGERGHTAWGYCHVPNGWKGDATAEIEAQMERFAPGFGARVLARKSWGTQALEGWNANLVGGDVSGGAMTPWQVAMRPTPRLYETSRKGLWICSSATPPGGGVHGMCGWHAARRALRSVGIRPAE